MGTNYKIILSMLGVVVFYCLSNKKEFNNKDAIKYERKRNKKRKYIELQRKPSNLY